MGAFGGVPPQGIAPALGHALSDTQIMESLIAQQAAVRQSSVAANMPQGAAANFPPSQPSYQASYETASQVPLYLPLYPGYYQSGFQNRFSSLQNSIPGQPTQVTINLIPR